MPSETRGTRGAWVYLRAFAAGLLAAGVATVVLTVPSTGANATNRGPAEQAANRAAGYAAALQPGSEPDPGQTPPDQPPPPTEPAETATPDPSPTQPEPTATPTTPPKETQGPGPVPDPTVTGGPAEPQPTVPPEQPGPVIPGKPRLGINVWTGDIKLSNGYWSRGSTTARLKVSFHNSGQVVERVALRYTLPVGLTDAGTPGCSLAAGRTYACGAWMAGPGLRWSTTLRIRVDGDAWRRMPLSGSVNADAVAPGRPDLGSASDNQGFAVLFPPGPPVAGIDLAATAVTFGAVDRPANLQVTLKNTGDTASTGAVEVILPEGVTAAAGPAGCGPAAGRTRCELGRIPAGQSAAVDLPLTATVDAQQLAPLSGAVIGLLTAQGRTKQVQMSFLISADAATATAEPVPGGATPTGSQGTIGGFAQVAVDRPGMTGLQKTAVALVVVSVLLVVLALALATTSLRRRMEDEPVDAAVPTE